MAYESKQTCAFETSKHWNPIQNVGFLKQQSKLNQGLGIPRETKQAGGGWGHEKHIPQHHCSADTNEKSNGNPHYHKTLLNYR
jgi:hypothetical protein